MRDRPEPEGQSAAGTPPDASPPRAERDPAKPDPDWDPDAAPALSPVVSSPVVLSPVVPCPVVSSPVAPFSDLTPTARHILTTLRAVDSRLMLSERDVARLTPAVLLWLERGVLPFAITFALSDDIPRDLRHPAGLVAYRLRELLPAPVPASAPTPTQGSASTPTLASASTPFPSPDLPGDRPRPHPIQVCVRCDSISFRAAEPGLCNPCKREEKEAA
ncbi:hypothetical protein [Streptomyces sp. NPDC007369]|uniref:hypothetical protein n=1 Tax=Streptomyces sp. NPDC007369 TaxID=3154589 RepID=UPI0033E9E1C0